MLIYTDIAKLLIQKYHAGITVNNHNIARGLQVEILGKRGVGYIVSVGYIAVVYDILVEPAQLVACTKSNTTEMFSLAHTPVFSISLSTSTTF